MSNVARTSSTEVPEHLRPVKRAFDRALKKAFLSGEAYDPDGKGYAYWKARDEAEKASTHDSE